MKQSEVLFHLLQLNEFMECSYDFHVIDFEKFYTTSLVDYRMRGQRWNIGFYFSDLNRVIHRNAEIIDGATERKDLLFRFKSLDRDSGMFNLSALDFYDSHLISYRPRLTYLLSADHLMSNHPTSKRYLKSLINSAV